MATARSKYRVLTALVLLLLVIPAAAGAGTVFTDVDDTGTHAAGIAFVKDAGITKGCGDGIYCPGEPVTRAQMATFLLRFAEFLGATDGTVDLADFAQSASNADTVDGAQLTELLTKATYDIDSDGVVDDAGLLEGRAASSYDTFVIGAAKAAGDQSTYDTVTAGSPGLILLELPFTTTHPGDVAVTGSASFLAPAGGGVQIDVWFEFGASDPLCYDFINAINPAAFRRATVDPAQYAEISLTAIVPLPSPGDQVVRFCAQTFGNSASVLSTGLTGVVSASSNNTRTLEILPP